MECDKAVFQATDKCETPCKCNFLYKPVCGVDGRNYLNECELNCKKIQKAFDGRCDSGPVQKCIYCIGDLSKVCGKDNKTYDNLCYLKCNKVDFNYNGSCLPPTPQGVCVCPKVYLPVCSADNQTYDNECLARCATKSIAYNGPCKPANTNTGSASNGQAMDACLQQCAKFGSNPVCGTDGKTYGNECATTCNSVMLVAVAKKEPCKVIVHEQCPCNTEYKPVCGVDGKTYLNICTIQCAGINKAWDGPCGVIGNYGYIMSQYHTEGTGAGAFIRKPKKLRRHYHKRATIKHIVPKIAPKREEPAKVPSKREERPRKHSASDRKWETQTIKVVYNTGSKDSKTKYIVGDELN
jgi:hypothetical protein